MTEQRKKDEESVLPEVIETFLELSGPALEAAGEAIGGTAGMCADVVGEVLASLG